MDGATDGLVLRTMELSTMLGLRSANAEALSRSQKGWPAGALIKIKLVLVRAQASG